MKNVALLTEDGTFALFFRPHPREFAIQGKKMPMPRAQPGGGGLVELTYALWKNQSQWMT